mmetsp:Transcript_2067/g.2790  ORF Transcript_2067/g.2790 Transcript_2067/m.2790 type:complete len:211 (+) Transcript_2067:264-896(+)
MSVTRHFASSFSTSLTTVTICTRFRFPARKFPSIRREPCLLSSVILPLEVRTLFVFLILIPLVIRTMLRTTNGTLLADMKMLTKVSTTSTWSESSSLSWIPTIQMLRNSRKLLTTQSLHLEIRVTSLQDQRTSTRRGSVLRCLPTTRLSTSRSTKTNPTICPTQTGTTTSKTPKRNWNGTKSVICLFRWDVLDMEPYLLMTESQSGRNIS